MKVKYIGLDISTSIVGICLLDSRYNLVNLHFENLKKIKNIFSKAKCIERKLEEIKSSYGFEEDIELSIEESFQSFSKGFSSAKTLSQLNRFNGIVSYIAAEVYSVIPVYINVNSARKKLSIKLDRKSNISTKEQVFSWVKLQEDTKDFVWPEKVMKSGPNKGLVKFDESCYDMSDAYVICKALKYETSNNI
jgi:hypothetical protein